jgi:acyl carrier protein
MTKDEMRALIVAELGNVAPETDAARIDPDADLRDALDIDSLDFLNFLEALHKKTGVNVPEPDYGMLLTVNGAVVYLAEKLAR